MASKKNKRDINTIASLKESLFHSNGHHKCLVIDEPSSKWGYRSISTELIPSDAIPILDNGRTYLLGFDGTELWPIEYMPEDNQNKTPEDCFEAGCWEELVTLAGMVNKAIEKIKLGIFVFLIIAFAIILFLLVPMISNQGGIV